MAFDPRPVCGYCEQPLDLESGWWRGSHLGGCFFHEDPGQRRSWFWAATPTSAGSVLPEADPAGRVWDERDVRRRRGVGEPVTD